VAGDAQNDDGVSSDRQERIYEFMPVRELHENAIFRLDA
jgi:hypothetical protein